jgi:hypothetical protein
MKKLVWHSYHLFYHGSRSLLIKEVVRPAVGALLAQGHIDRFFFVRYNLGGPHVRLRLLASADLSTTIKEILVSASESFFARHPSASSMPHDTIRHINRTILATDPREWDHAIYPNHSLHELPFQPETERYGGPELLGYSLDFFAFSSLEAIRFLVDHVAGPRGRQMAAISRILIRQALGFAEAPQELVSLLEYPMDTWGTPLSDFVACGDEAFQRQRDHLRRLLCKEVEQFLSNPLPASFEPARCFRWEIRTADERRLRCIKNSQMHMTANRLGLSNPEEVYLSRLLSRTARDLAGSAPDLWRALEQCLEEEARGSRGPSHLPELLPSALATVFPQPIAPSAAVSVLPGPHKKYEWVHFVARHSAAGRSWAEEYKLRCGDVYQETRKSLGLLRKRQITAGREALTAARSGLSALGYLPPSLAHVMDRWYYGALAYYFYCVSSFDAALEAIKRANEAVESAIGCEPLLLPFAQTCHEFPLHKARIAYVRGRWREVREQIGLAWQSLHDERPLCVLPDGTAIYFSRLIEFYRQIPSLDADEEASLQSVFDENARRNLFERTAAGIYATPVIPYP